MITGTAWPLFPCSSSPWEEAVVPSGDQSSPSAGPNVTIHLPRRKAES